MTPEQQDLHDTLDKRSDTHLTAARCAKHLYYTTKLHYHLQNGYSHYSHCIDYMGADLAAFFKLPKVLFEFGNLLENYGAMGAAMEVYNKILSRFPNFNGYFDTMYRCGVVGKHLVEAMSDPKVSKSLSSLLLLLL